MCIYFARTRVCVLCLFVCLFVVRACVHACMFAGVWTFPSTNKC